MVDAQALITKETVTTEDRANFDKMIAAADVDSADITRMQAVDKFNAEQRASGRPPRAGFGNDDKSKETVKNHVPYRVRGSFRMLRLCQRVQGPAWHEDYC